MAYLVYLASMKKIECQGIDWWLDEWLYDFSTVDWDYRENRMVQLILESLEENQAMVVLVAVGAAHVDPFISRLIKKGYSEVESPEWDLTVDEYPDVPQAVITMWKQGTKYLSKLPVAKTQRIQKKINSLKEVVQARGYKFAREKK